MQTKHQTGQLREHSQSQFRERLLTATDRNDAWHKQAYNTNETHEVNGIIEGRCAGVTPVCSTESTTPLGELFSLINLIYAHDDQYGVKRRNNPHDYPIFIRTREVKSTYAIEYTVHHLIILIF